MSGSVLMWEHHSWESPIRVGGRAFAEHFLAEGWKVAWLNGPLAVWNLVGGNEETRRRRAAWRSGGEDRAWGEGRLFTYAPLGPVAYRAYPVLSRPWFHRHSLDLTCPPLLRVLERRGFEEVELLWLATGSPFLPLLDRIRHRQSLYRLSDESLAFPDTPRSYDRLEQEVMRRVDRVIATAHWLAERARRVNSSVHLVPNGVDVDRFARARHSALSSASLRTRPRVVYVGALDRWFDTARVATLARALPGADLYLAGPSRIGSAWARDLPNVHLAGPVPPEEVPHLLARSDVGIIPFVDSRLTRAIHPVKLYEYFAAGLPVVASDLEEIRRIGSPAILVRTDAEWVEALREALAGGSRPEFAAFASRHDWSSRYAELMSALGRPALPGAAGVAGGGGR